MNVRVMLTSTRPEALLYAALEDVSPDGSADVVTYGQQVASQRAVDTRRSWYRDGQLIAPYHLFSAAAARPLASGQQVAVDIELYGTLTRLRKGHVLRLVLASGAAHLTPGAKMLGDLVGGVYSIAHDATAPSSVTLMTLLPSSLPRRCAIC
jgi:predicted acyl esterase